MNIHRQHLGDVVPTASMYPIPQNSVLQYATGGLNYGEGLAINGISYGLSGLGQTSGAQGTGLLGTGLFASLNPFLWGPGEWIAIAGAGFAGFAAYDFLNAGGRRRR
jgi:hypothetical protein